MARPIVKREYITRGVVEVIARKGLHATTIQDIADAAQVSPGLLYRYWEDRDDLAAEVYVEHYERVLQFVAGRVALQADFAGKLRAMVEAVLQFADEQTHILRFLLFSQHELATHVTPERNIHHWLEQLLDEGMRAGVVRSLDRQVAVQILIGIVLQPIVGGLYGRSPTPFLALRDELLRAIEGALLVSPRVTGKVVGKARK